MCADSAVELVHQGLIRMHWRWYRSSWSSVACFVDSLVVVCESEVLLDYQLEIIGGFVVEIILVECGVHELVILKLGLQLGM